MPSGKILFLVITQHLRKTYHTFYHICSTVSQHHPDFVLYPVGLKDGKEFGRYDGSRVSLIKFGAT